MKIRALVVLDLEVDGFKAAANEQDKIEELVSDFTENNSSVVWSGVDVRERRGDTPPDLNSMKFRRN